MYGALRDLSCLSEEFWRSSRLRDTLSVLRDRPVALESMTETMKRMICGATGQTDASLVYGAALIDVPSHVKALDQCLQFWTQLGHDWQKKPFHAALCVLLEKGDVEVMRVMVSLLVKGSLECTARKSAVFVAVIQATGISLDKGPLLNCIHAFVDEFKVRSCWHLFLR